MNVLYPDKILAALGQLFEQRDFFFPLRYLYVYLDKLQVRQRTYAEVRYVLEGGAGDLGDAAAGRAALGSALSAAQGGRAVQVAPVRRRTKLWRSGREGIKE